MLETFKGFKLYISWKSALFENNTRFENVLLQCSFNNKDSDKSKIWLYIIIILYMDVLCVITFKYTILSVYVWFGLVWFYGV